MSQEVVQRVGYLYLPATDIDASIEWYQNVLGLELKSKFGDDDSHIAVFNFKGAPNVALLLFETTDTAPASYKRNGHQFQVAALNCLDIEYSHRTLKEKGVEVGDIVVLGNGEAKYFYFHDLNGNRMEMAWSIWD